MTLNDLRGSGANLLHDLEPWACITSKELARRFDVDPFALAMWRYRGIVPPTVPENIVKGRAVAFLVVDFQNWLDPTTSPLERLRQALLPHFDDVVMAPSELVLIYAATMAERVKPVGFEFARNGQKQLQQFIMSRKNDYDISMYN